MFFIKNRLVKILTVLTVLLLFFSFGLFISDITSDDKVESVVIDYEPVHSLSSSDNLYYGTDNYVEGDYYFISGNTNFILVDLYAFSSCYDLSIEEIIGDSIISSLGAYWKINYEFEYYEDDGDSLVLGLRLYSDDYDVLAYSGFSFDLSLYVNDFDYIEVTIPYDGTSFNSLDEAWYYALDKYPISSSVCTFYFNPFVNEDSSIIITLETAYELGYLTTQGTGIVEVITSTIAPFGLGILNAISSYFTALFFDNGSLSNFAIFSFVLVGISLVMGLTYVIYNLVKRKR